MTSPAPAWLTAAWIVGRQVAIFGLTHSVAADAVGTPSIIARTTPRAMKRGSILDSSEPVSEIAVTRLRSEGVVGDGHDRRGAGLVAEVDPISGGRVPGHGGSRDAG